jgi:hypothetical protein
MPKRRAPEFEALARVVSEEAKCPLLLVEKDYWIVQILDRLVSKFGDLIIFKGGTSLSKACGLIDRFSEDVDILLDSSKCTSQSQQRKTISELRKFLETSPGLHYLPPPRSAQGDNHGLLWYGYESVFEDDKQAILVEVGFRGGTNPTEPLTVNSMIGQSLATHGESTDEYKPVKIRVLHPKRTLIEKLFALAAAANAGNLPQKNRHYYDVFCLLNNKELDNFIGSPEFFEIVDDVCKQSLQNFGHIEDVSTLLSSSAFSLDDAEYRTVSRAYTADTPLYFKIQPPFKSVYSSVHKCIEKLQHSIKSSN